MNTKLLHYLRIIRPSVEVEGYFQKPRGVFAFLGTIFYFNFDVEFGTWFVSIHVAAFGLGVKLSVEDPAYVTLGVDAFGAEGRVAVGLTTDWDVEKMLREADADDAAFKKYVDGLKDGETIDRAWFDSDRERKACIRDVRSDFRHQFWTALPDADIPLSNGRLVFKEEGVFAEVRSGGHVALTGEYTPLDAAVTPCEYLNEPYHDDRACIRCNSACCEHSGLDPTCTDDCQPCFPFCCPQPGDEDNPQYIVATVGDVRAGEVDAEGRIATEFEGDFSIAAPVEHNHEALRRNVPLKNVLGCPACE